MWQTIFEVIGIYLLAALAVERITEVITTGEIFAPVRMMLADKLYTIKYGPFVHKLLTCSYCFSHWVAFFVSLLLPGGWFQFGIIDNIIIKWFALVGLSNLYHSTFVLIWRGRQRAHQIDMILNLKDLRDSDSDDFVDADDTVAVEDIEAATGEKLSDKDDIEEVS